MTEYEGYERLSKRVLNQMIEDYELAIQYQLGLIPIPKQFCVNPIKSKIQIEEFIENSPEARKFLYFANRSRYIMKCKLQEIREYYKVGTGTVCTGELYDKLKNCRAEC